MDLEARDYQAAHADLMSQAFGTGGLMEQRDEARSASRHLQAELDQCRQQLAAEQERNTVLVKQVHAAEEAEAATYEALTDRERDVQRAEAQLAAAQEVLEGICFNLRNCHQQEEAHVADSLKIARSWLSARLDAAQQEPATTPAHATGMQTAPTEASGGVSAPQRHEDDSKAESKRFPEVSDA